MNYKIKKKCKSVAWTCDETLCKCCLVKTYMSRVVSLHECNDMGDQKNWITYNGWIYIDFLGLCITKSISPMDHSKFSQLGYVKINLPPQYKF